MKFDLEHFAKTKWSFVLIKRDKIIFKSRLSGLKPLILCIKKHKAEMSGAIVYDKIVGQAAAILLNYARVKEIWSPTVSKTAAVFLKRKKIKLSSINVTKYIINRNGDNVCPMEKMSQKMGESEFVRKLLESEA